VPVRVIRDEADWVLFGVQLASLVVTVIAVVLAYLEIRWGQKERRLDFELTVLRELLVAASQIDMLRLQTLAWTLPDEVVPITRAAAMVPTTEEGEHIVARLPPIEGETHLSAQYLHALKDEVREELVKAIEERVHARKAIR
jgi:hypothetical protein